MSYRKKHIKNKISKIKPKKSILKMPVFWIFILALIFLFNAFYFLLFFSGFQIKNITISGNEKIQSRDIKNLFLNSIGTISKSIFLINSAELQQIILKTFPSIEVLSIEKQLPQTINLKIEERKPFAVFCQPEKECFFIDKNGVIFSAIGGEKFQDMLILKQTPNAQKIFLGENIIEKNAMDLILKVKKNLKDNFQIDIKEALVANSIRLDLTTSENWQIYFDLKLNADLQIIKLNSLLKNEISQANRANLQYIDLRFKDRAYYK